MNSRKGHLQKSTRKKQMHVTRDAHVRRNNTRKCTRPCLFFPVSRNKLLNFRESLHADVSECFENKNRQPHVVHRWCARGTWRDTQSPSRRRRPVSCWSSLVRCGAELRTILPHVVVRISGISVRGYWPLRRPAHHASGKQLRTMSREVAISTPQLSTTCQHVSVEDVVVASLTVAPIVQPFRRAFFLHVLTCDMDVVAIVARSRQSAHKDDTHLPINIQMSMIMSMRKLKPTVILSNKKCKNKKTKG